MRGALPPGGGNSLSVARPWERGACHVSSKPVLEKHVYPELRYVILIRTWTMDPGHCVNLLTELKITAGPRPFTVQFSTTATQNLIMIVSNCTEGQLKFHFGQPNPKYYF